MTTNSANVRVAVTGEVSMGPTSAAAPTGTASTITGFTGLGLVSSDGITETRDRTTANISAWQNGARVRTVVTDSALHYHFVLLETNLNAVQLFYGATVTQSVTEGNWNVVPANTGGTHSFVIDVVDGSNLLRVYIPSGEVTDIGDVKYANGEAIGYECTITAYDSSAISAAAKIWATALHT